MSIQESLRMQWDLSQVLEQVGEPETYEVVSPFWETSIATLPREGVPFLQHDAIDEGVRACEFDSAALRELYDAAEQVAADPALAALIWHAYLQLTEYPVRHEFAQWPRLEKAMGRHFGAFYLLAGLAVLRRIVALHQRCGWPEHITRDTCQVVPSLCSNHLRFEGSIGILPRQFHWMGHHHRGELVRIGRMEWMQRRMSNPVHVFRHNKTGQTVALMEGGHMVNTQGLLHWRNDSEPPGGWTTHFHREGDHVEGHVIHPDGIVLREQLSLDLNHWTHRLSRGMPTLDLHIPEGGGMTPDRCHDSMRGAIDFFNQYMPGWQYGAFACSSWIFNPQLQDILSPDSNLVQFQKQLYLFPIATGPTDGFFFIFGREKIDWNNPPRQTSLQRKIVDYLQQGHRWRGGGMFFLPEDLDRFGQQPYRQDWNLTAIRKLAE